MDLHTTKEDVLMPSDNTELPINIIDLIISSNIESDTNTEPDVNNGENHDHTNTDTEDEVVEEAKVPVQEETEKENLYNIDIVGHRGLDKKEILCLSNEEDPNNLSNCKENGSENGNHKDDTNPSETIVELWAEAIKAQNEGHYKHAIRNFTAILENKDSTPELKHKTKCRLVFALYQDNQADEAEKIGWESDTGSSTKQQSSNSTTHDFDSAEIVILQNDEDPDDEQSSTTLENINEPNKNYHANEGDISQVNVSSLSIKDTKPAAPTYTPPNGEESTIKRVSECSDDSNLTKLDLSQLVAETEKNSESIEDAQDIKKGLKQENIILPITTTEKVQLDTDVLRADEIQKDKCIVGPISDEMEQMTNSTTTTSTSALTNDTNPVDIETVSEVDCTPYSSPPKKKEKKKKKTTGEKAKNKATESTETFNCLHCNVRFYIKNDFQAHCRTEKHQHTVMSDEGRSWKYRAPPRGVGSEVYSICSNVQGGGSCSFGVRCVGAHSSEELKEWKERFEYRHKKIQRAAKLYGKSFADTLLDKLTSSNYPEKILVTKIDKVDCTVSGEKEIKVHNKGSEHFWSFSLATKNDMKLLNVALINDASRHQFSLISVKQTGHIVNRDDQDYEILSIIHESDKIEHIFETDLSDSPQEYRHQQQEWSHPDPKFVKHPNFTKCTDMKYEIKIKFKTDIYGTFRQSVVFSFGTDPPYLRQDLCVEVTPQPDDDEEKLKELQDRIIRQAERWDSTNSKIIDFMPPLSKPPAQDELILKKYPAPKPNKFQPTQNVVDAQLTKQNYRGRMHELLCIEEMAQFENVMQFNVVSKLQVISKYLLTPTSSNSSTAKYARPGEMFGKMKLGNNLSEDTPAGRLILTNCPTLFISVTKKEVKTREGKKLDKGKADIDVEEALILQSETKDENDDSKTKDSKARIAYVVGIEDTGKNTLYLRLPSTLVANYTLKDEEDFEVEVQFQLNRLPLCEMHHAVDRLPDLSLVYPDIREKIVIPWSPGKQWGDDLNGKLNPKQREAVVAITTPLVISLPPILIIGPYGTGKTFTLGQAIKMLLKQESHRRVLVCTHSNSAADLYIREYLHPFIEKEGNSNIKLLRVYYENRWVQTVNQVVQQYCLITMTESGTRSFRYPTLEDVKDCDVVVATLSTSRYLNGIGLKQGHFTHILLDEAAQAMECEAVMPLALSSMSTRVVLAGDHMQLSPEVFSQFALDKKFNKSLLERLYDFYPQSFACKILLCENYRSHEAIINYTSELFYEQKLIASGKQTAHGAWYPLTMFTARGEDVQDQNSTSFYNNSEVYEVVERVAELQRTWPKKEWGERDENSIGIVTPYYDQVQRIRSELRKRRLFGVSVERVLNVQGKQFRAIFLSTVRTRKTCISSQEDMIGGDLDFGFLSNAKLLNTAITRAQSLVAVVGDPIALCSMGKCRKLWERFMSICQEHKSLMGLTWSALRTMLDNVDMKKAYVLNPLAPEFVPRSKQRYNESFLKIYNEIMKQQLTAVAVSSKSSTTSTQFPNVLGGTGLVPPPPLPPFAYPVNPHPFFQPGVAGCIPPPPRHPPPLHPHTAAARRLSLGHIPGPFNPYMTVPPLPPIPPPWGMKLPPVPDMAFPPAQLMPNIPIPPPSLQVVVPSSATTNPITSQHLGGPKGDTAFGLGIFNNLSITPRQGSVIGNPLASSNPNLAQLSNLPQGIGPLSPKTPFTRAPFQSNMVNQNNPPFSQVPPANPQFANSKFQRGPTSSNSPIMAENVPSSLTVNPSFTSSSNELNVSDDTESKTIIPPLDSSFIYLQGGVHFPKTPSAKTASNVSNKFADSVKPPTTQIELIEPYKESQHLTTKPPNLQMIEQQNKQNQPTYMKEESTPAWFEMALDILPQDFEINSLLQSPQIQKAWFNQLTISRGPKEAALFQELIINLQKHPDLVMILKEKIMSNTSFKAATSTIKEDYRSSQPNLSIEGGHFDDHSVANQKPAILAEDLEAMLLNESDNVKISQRHSAPMSQSHPFLSNQSKQDPRLQTMQKQSQFTQKQINEPNIFTPASSSGDAFFSMMRGNNLSSVESSVPSDYNSSSRTSLKTDKIGVDGCIRNTENSIEDIYNDPILSEILRNSTNSSPDSGVCNNDSVTSLQGQQSATSQSTQNIDWRRSFGPGSQSTDIRNLPDYKTLFDERQSSSNNQTNITSDQENNGSYVPLYMRRAGTSSSTVSQATDSSRLNKYEEATAANVNERKFLPLSITPQNDTPKTSYPSRFTVDPISAPLNEFSRQAQFERARSVMPNFGIPPPPLTAPPELRHPPFSNVSKQSKVEAPSQKAPATDPNKPLSYANVLAAKPKTAKDREMEAAMLDPINRIRSLGTLANQDDKMASGGAIGGFGVRGGSTHSHIGNNEPLLRQEENQQNAAWFNMYNKRW